MRNTAFGSSGLTSHVCLIHPVAACYSDISDKYNDKDMYLVGPNGTVNKDLYNPNYAANRGRAWMESVYGCLDTRHTTTRGGKPAV